MLRSPPTPQVSVGEYVSEQGEKLWSTAYDQVMNVQGKK